MKVTRLPLVLIWIALALNNRGRDPSAGRAVVEPGCYCW
jgi:hypothetical protein